MSLEPYASHTQINRTTNAQDTIFPEGTDGGFNPVVSVVPADGEDISKGMIGYITIGIGCDRAKPACETLRHLEEALKAERENRLNSDQYTPPKALSSGSSPLEIPHQFLSSWSATTYLLESYSFDAALSNFRWHLGFCGPRAAPFALTPSFSSTVYERTGFVLNIEDFLNQLAQSFKLQYPTHSTRTIVPKWPPRSLIQRSIEYFSKNRLYSIFPAVDIENTPLHLDPKALGNPDITTSPANYACLVALTALVTRIRGDDLAFADADPDAYVQAVLTLLPELMIDNANLRSLEALILLVSGSGGPGI
ncbi:unnamed protein product [Aspergillus oryzae var. brunneus]|uniref:Unnamed protein product n=1 Tax=Aspergillus oryzae var. brunneus TaxID=332754 RepID=A0ABQ6KMJ1_ASPOZ|nr:unnamed protein product [Aspergillus oryzae var. brunneus]